MASDGSDRAEHGRFGAPIASDGPIAFDGYVLDLADARLTGPDGPVALGNKALRVLAALVGAEGRLLTKDMLFEQVWEGVIVSDAALTSVIKELRRALGDDPRTPRFIESVYGKGYRFLSRPQAAAPTRAEPPSPVGPASTNLPIEDGPLIGREADLAAIDALLFAPGGLVTVVGPGGMGKTRLALAAARRHLASRRDGVWLVELSTLGNAGDIPYRTAAAMGIALGTGGDTLPSLIERLRRRQCLIVLDNCEHLVEGAAALAAAIRSAAPGVMVLATSQEALGVAGETVVPLEALDRRDATELFLLRARASDPVFAAAANDDPAVPRICDTLDRLPLAIEMAAARAPALGCTALLDRLGARMDANPGGRFAVLTRGSRSAEPRQRTLHATLAWSHDLLGPDEAAVFRRLAVFGGPFALDAAVAVAALGRDDLSEMRVLDALDALVARSLLVRKSSREAAGEPRYALFETMRAFGRERLAEAAEVDAAHRAHAAWYVAAAEPMWSDFCGDVSDHELERRHRENMDNLLGAVRWCYTPGGDAELGHLAVARSAALWSDRLLYRRIGAALTRIGPQTPAAIRARLLGSRAHVLMRLKPLDAIKVADEAVIAARATTNDPWTLIDVLCSKGFALWSIGRTEQASAVADEVAAILPVDTPSRIAGLGLGLIACTTFSREGLDAARPIFARSVAMLRAVGAHGLATFWAMTALRFETEAPLDRQIEQWRALLAGIGARDMYADPLTTAASVELVSRLAMRGTAADMAEARTLTERAFRRGEMASEYRFFIASALVALREGRAEAGARLIGHARAVRAQSGDTAIAEPAFAVADALATELLPADTRLVLEQLGARMSDAEATTLALSPPGAGDLTGAAA